MQPEDWDEDAPYEILDTEAVKPEGWLDDEPLTIPDPGKHPRVASFINRFPDTRTQTHRSPMNGMTRRTVIGLHLPSLTLSARRPLAVVNGKRAFIVFLPSMMPMVVPVLSRPTLITRANGSPP